MPSSITVYLFGTCSDPDTPLFYGEDPTLQFAAIIEYDANIACFVLAVEGTGAAPLNCQPLYWAGYGPLTGNYTRICGPDGGCAANVNISTVSVSM